MSVLAYLDNGDWLQWTGERRPGPDGDLYSLAANAGDLLSEGELAGYGLAKVQEAEPIPTGSRVLSSHIGEAGGIVRWVHVLEPIPLTELKAAKLAAVADKRWQVETGGITVAGAAVMTDRESQALITGAALQAFMDASYSLVWKTAIGDFVTLSAAQLLAIAQAVRAHVQASFDREATLTSAIDAAADAAALAAINIEAGWPS